MANKNRHTVYIFIYYYLRGRLMIEPPLLFAEIRKKEGNDPVF